LNLLSKRIYVEDETCAEKIRRIDAQRMHNMYNTSNEFAELLIHRMREF